MISSLWQHIDRDAQKIIKMNLGYNLPYKFCRIFVRFAFRSNYRKRIYVNDEIVPKDVPVIFAPNHRNAVIDGLTLVSYYEKNIVFLARADFFKSKFLRILFNFLNVTPIYRSRDGMNNLSKNEEVFDLCGKILSRKNPICLFPEGKHSPKQSLLPIQKGVPRIALPTEQYMDFNLNIHIVPTIIYYSDIHGFLSDYYVFFCKPIKTCDYKDLYQQNPPAAINQMRNDIEKEMKKEMIDITNDAYYNFYQYCIDFCADKVAKEKFPKEKDAIPKACKLIINRLDDLFKNDNSIFLQTVNYYGRAFSILANFGLTSKDKLQRTNCFSIFSRLIGLILISPLAIYGLINGIFPIITYFAVRSKVKDQQFISSLRVAVAVFILPIFFILQTVLVGCLTHSFVNALIYLSLLSPTLLLGCYWRKWFKDLFRRIKVNKFIKKHTDEWKFVMKLIDYHTWL